MKTVGALIDVAAALLSIGAGLYLLSQNSISGSNWFQVLAHGIGVYFIAKGLYIGRSLYMQSQAIELELRASMHGAEK